jgi:predicted nuclease with TOPRIM domain
LRDYADTKNVDLCGLCREAADIIERLALWEDMGPRQADAIVRLTDEINHLEQNFTEWLKEYRKLSERVVELERTLALSGREG